MAHILVVDGEQSILDVLTRFLTREGHTVRTALNGRAGLAAAQAEHPELMILAVTMTEIDGFTVCRRLKDDPQTAQIPIILLTGLIEPEYRAQGMAAGADVYHTHPFDRALLAEQIRSLLDGRQPTSPTGQDGDRA